MWSFLLLLCVAPAKPAVQDEPSLILRGGDNPCMGYIEIYYQGQWGIVGDNKWTRSNEDVVCQSIGCGRSLGSVDVLRQNTNSIVWVNEVTCTGSEDQLWECPGFAGWNVSFYIKDSYKHITCSDRIEMSLDGFRCAGVVKYTKISDGNKTDGYFCHENWAKDDADLVCNALNCGKHKAIPDPETMTPMGFLSAARTKIRCTGTKRETHLWQCSPQQSLCQRPATVTCSGHVNVRLQGGDNVCNGTLQTEEAGVWKPAPCHDNETVTESDAASFDVMCRQMHCGTGKMRIPATCKDGQVSLTCPDRIRVTVSPNQAANRCFGPVYIEGLGGLWPVCGQNWDTNAGTVVCRELGCGKVIKVSTQISSTSGILDWVKCSGKEASLWHCGAKYNRKPFPCSSTASVTCGDSLDVRLTDGLGKCHGRVEIKYESKWYSVTNLKNANKVCKLLKCNGLKSDKSVTYKNEDKILGTNVNCVETSKSISDCVTEIDITRSQTAVEITCEGHKVVFLKGARSCSGMVGIEHGEKDYWLSGSNENWNQNAADAVCRQMHCGKCTNFTSVNLTKETEMGEGIWGESYNCSSAETSLFNCPNDGTSSNHSIASVTCSEETTMRLSKICWGKMEVCASGECGGVCSYNWPNTLSDTVCENLGCGTSLPVEIKIKDMSVNISRMEITQQTTKVTDCNMVRGDYCVTDPVYIVCSGSVKARIQLPRDQCFGNIEIFYQGNWLQVCLDALKDRNVQNAICKELRCGQADDDAAVGFFGPRPDSNDFVSAMSCPENSQSLTKCKVSLKTGSCPLGGLRCSDWRTMVLKMPESGTGTCEGKVFVHRKDTVSAVSSDSWTVKEGQTLCKDLGCGSYKAHHERNHSSRGETFNCTDVENPRNIWDCQPGTSPAQSKQLYIQCQDNREVNLSKNCSGEVTISGISVCDTDWEHMQSHIVCQAQGCGNAIPIQKAKAARGHTSASIYHVSCGRYESHLGQCKTTRGKCHGGPVSVYCVDNVKFNTTEKCGGQIMVQYRDEWEFVCPIESPDINFKYRLCDALKCGQPYTPLRKKRVEKVDLQTKLIYHKNIQNIKHCVHQEPCGKQQPAEIYCYGYVEPDSGPILSAGAIAGLFLGAAALVALIVTFLFRRRRILQKLPPIISGRKQKFEGDYEDVGRRLPSEMRRFSRRRSESEANASDSSLSYDDIAQEEGAMTELLTSGGQDVNAAVQGPGSTSTKGSSEKEDATVYEGEDSQDGYDDVAAGPDVVEMVAEVHSSLEARPEKDQQFAGGEPPADADYEPLDPDV
ncbi:antigen WC1.1 [Lampris incognitus]|uniref:antigen WC1.1 n=1 Tax=Lampris incognitus TaxID=2546036 RepID=UPI0024B4B83E|nr:antigen WC1.1 [Lampris incognitus]